MNNIIQYSKLWRNSIFIKLTITFIILLIPLYSLGIFIYNSALQSMYKEVTSSIISRTTFNMDNLEKELQKVKYLRYNLVSDINLNRLSAIPESMTEKEKIWAIVNLQKNLDVIKTSSAYIQQVSVHIPAINRVVYDNSVEKFEQSKYSMMIKSSNAANAIVYYFSNPVILMNSPYIDYLTGTPMYVIEIILDMNIIINALKQYDIYDGSGLLLYSSELKRSIVKVSISNEVENQIVDKLNHSQENLLVNNSVNESASDLFIFTNSDELAITMAIYVPKDVLFTPVTKYKRWFWIFTITAAAIICGFSFSILRTVYKPLTSLINAFERVTNGDMSFSIDHNRSDEFCYLYSCFNTMVNKLRVLIDQVYKQRLLAKNAQLKQLQSQINPHFLYNSFFMLHRMVLAKDYEKLESISELLGSYFKYITRSANDYVNLSEEVDHARVYANIQMMRFYNRISILFDDLPLSLRSVIVPRLILQPLIENSIEHGMSNIEENGLIRICFQTSCDALTIIVTDNGNGVNDDEFQQLISKLYSEDEDQIENTGIINIHKRIRLKYGHESGLFIVMNESGGLRTEIRIQYKEDEHV